MKKISFAEIPSCHAKLLIEEGLDALDPNLVCEDDCEKRKIFKGKNIVGNIKVKSGFILNPGTYYFGQVEKEQPNGYGVYLSKNQVAHGIFVDGNI